VIRIEKLGQLKNNLRKNEKEIFLKNSFILKSGPGLPHASSSFHSNCGAEG